VAGTPRVVDVLLNEVESRGGSVDSDIFPYLFPFPLDDFQRSALDALAMRKSVIVSAPTGSGKTICGELAIYYALALGLRVMYTTPLKALSNQKFVDFRRQLGADRVGLLTGDTSYNRDASVLVMTTEVFRNMLYHDDSETASADLGKDDLNNVFAVILDEMHYMNDPSRGTVWEESVIHCPEHVLLVALSATMSNVDDIRGWMQHVHGPTELISSDQRPVPLRYLFAHRKGIEPLFRDAESGPGAAHGSIPPSGSGSRKGKRGLPARLQVSKALLERHEDARRLQARIEAQARERRMPSPSGKRGRRRHENDTPSHRNSNGRGNWGSVSQQTPSYSYVVRELQRTNLLPAIVFIFSRVGCERAADSVAASSRSSLLTEAERDAVRDKLLSFRAAHPLLPLDDERDALLLHGVATHHAGLLPLFKTLVEELFALNLCKVVFATETLAAGINMPARTAVISALSKRGDGGMQPLTPSQLLQMAGRAGRRGMDAGGSVVLLQTQYETVLDAHSLLLSPLDGIASQFRSSYGMAINLLRTRDKDSARSVVEKSFGNYLQSKRIDPVSRAASAAAEELARIEKELEPMTLADAKFYLKLYERLMAEERILEYLQRQDTEMERDIVCTILPLSRAGAALVLSSGVTAALLSCDDQEQLGGQNLGGLSPLLITALLPDGSITSVSAEEVRYVDNANGAGIPQAALAGATPPPFLELGLSIPQIPPPPEAGHVLRQRAVMERVKLQMAEHPAHALGPERRAQLLEMSRRIASLEKSQQEGRRLGRRLKQPAWEAFLAMVDVLCEYGALSPVGPNPQPTPLGDVIGAINAENELWLALVLTCTSVRCLPETALAGLISAALGETLRAGSSGAFASYGPSDDVISCVEELIPVASDLADAQALRGIDVPIHLDASVSGLVESWARGCEWMELCDSSSLDEGDLCRLLRRTMEVLRQIPVLPGVDPALKVRARCAHDAMDRHPVKDDVQLYFETAEEEITGPILVGESGIMDGQSTGFTAME
jgi:superfamily II RNA helicase